jgi:hypothetical protein
MIINPYYSITEKITKTTNAKRKGAMQEKHRQNMFENDPLIKQDMEACEAEQIGTLEVIAPFT